MAGYVGDTRKLERLRELFYQKQYAEVIQLAEELQFSDRLARSQRRMVEIARRKIALPRYRA